MRRKIRRVGWIVPLVAAATIGAAELHAADPADPDWPCQQRKVPAISAGQIWAGPPLDSVGNSWRDDPAISHLASRLAARRTEMEEAKRLIAEFADSAGAAKNEKLTALAAGVLSIINSDRASVIAGIESYAQRQEALASKIERQTAELQELSADDSEASRSKLADLQEIQTWDTRIFQERQQSLTYICEVPVELERRAFALGREIGRHLDP